MNTNIKQLLTKLSNNEITVDQALLEIKKTAFDEIDIAKVDNHRKILQGIGEVIYGENKTAEQIKKIVEKLSQDNPSQILITRLDSEKYDQLSKIGNISYYKEARIATIGDFPKPDGIGKILIVTAGTSDIPVAMEAEITAKSLGNEVEHIYDVGVAGLHRLLSKVDSIMTASVVIVIAGMEGALASVVGGLCDCPVIACPTSVGYGSSFEGLSALLSMLNSCASGISVVNIDNGFGAGLAASKINHMEAK